jgi:hypothetical protein
MWDVINDKHLNTPSLIVLDGDRTMMALITNDVLKNNIIMITMNNVILLNTICSYHFIQLYCVEHVSLYIPVTMRKQDDSNLISEI